MEKTFSKTIGGLILTLVASASIATFASIFFTSRTSSDYKVTSSRTLLSGGIYCANQSLSPCDNSEVTNRPVCRKSPLFLQFLILKDIGTSSDVGITSGYFYQKYFDSLGCTGTVTFVDGYSTGVCLQTSDHQSVTLVGRGMLNTTSVLQHIDNLKLTSNLLQLFLQPLESNHMFTTQLHVIHQRLYRILNILWEVAQNHQTKNMATHSYLRGRHQCHSFLLLIPAI